MKKRVLITGGRGGLARACGQVFSDAGWEVLAPGRESLDVRDSDSVTRYFEQAGDIDLLVCAAGVTADGLILKLDETSWDKVMETNLRGAYLCAKAASKRMLKRRSGQVLFVSSFSAYQPHLGQSNYAAAKAGLEGLAKSLAREWGGRGLRCNVVVPGLMETGMTEGLSPTDWEGLMGKHCLAAIHSAEQVAGFIYFLECQLPHTSGQVFNLDSRIL
ncbi:SDR family NAD(P)-dependent oxidoreductase [Rubritalea tangerina]|uniref:SDR family NAD(P)-dependent oxidoreductase n=1 Tax=Rubritalea tangerina TaxID=430798 RepID=A0ABW4ZDE9_9BACT